MTARERLLIWTVGPLVAVVGGGLLLYMCLIKPLADGAARIATATAELEEVRGKLLDEGRVEKRIFAIDPRLQQWQRMSVPESPDRAPTAITAHNTRMQDEYQRIIVKLFRDCGLTMTGTPKPPDPDSKTSPILSNKSSLYTRYVFTFDAEGTYDSFITMLEHLQAPVSNDPKFQPIPLLHKVSKLEITRTAPTASPVPVRGAVPARTGRGSPMLKFSLTMELLQVAGAEKRYTLLPYSLGTALAIGPAQAVLFTAPGTGHPTRVLANNPERSYADMLPRNLFFGQAIQSEITSDHFEALRFHKLVCITRKGFSSPQGMLYDQREKFPTEAESMTALSERVDKRYIFLRATRAVDFTIRDDHNIEVLALRVVEVTADEVLFKVVHTPASPSAPASPSTAATRITEKRAFPQDRSRTTDRPLISDDPDQIYRMRVGDFLTDALASRFQAPKQTSDKQEKTEKVEKIEKKGIKEE